MQKGLFLVCFFCFLVVLFFVACVLVLVFCKKAQKGYFPAILEVFCLFCSHKRPVLRCFFSSYFVFFAFVFSFKTPFYPFAFWPSAPFWKTLICLVSFFFFFLFFPFLMFACFFQTNFPNIPFLKSNLLSFLAVSFFLLFLFLFWLCMFQPFGFFVVMLALFLVFFWFCFVFCFCLLSCFGSSLWKKTVFPAILVFFEFCWLKGSFDFMFYVFVLVCLSCVVSFHLKIHFYYFASVFFCDKTKWSSCLHLVVLPPFLFFVV